MTRPDPAWPTAQAWEELDRRVAALTETHGQLPVVAVVGPTGVGKSEAALEIALRYGGEAVNADALQFYRGMDIGTAKLDPSERRGVPHHLLDTLDVTEEASVAVFQQEARAVFADLRRRGKVPVLVGGSGLYVRAALDHLEFPGTDPEVRARLEREADERGTGPLHRRLAHADSDAARKISVNDTRRVVRALEVLEVEGRPFSAFMPRREHVVPTVQVGIRPRDRDRLRRLLHARVERMWEAGLLAEAEELVTRGLREGKTAARAIGYSQALAVLDGHMTRGEAIEVTSLATGQFAKRQLTWFGADPRVLWWEREL